MPLAPDTDVAAADASMRSGRVTQCKTAQQGMTKHAAVSEIKIILSLERQF